MAVKAFLKGLAIDMLSNLVADAMKKTQPQQRKEEEPVELNLQESKPYEPSESADVEWYDAPGFDESAYDPAKVLSDEQLKEFITSTESPQIVELFEPLFERYETANEEQKNSLREQALDMCRLLGIQVPSETAKPKTEYVDDPTPARPHMAGARIKNGPDIGPKEAEDLADKADELPDEQLGAVTREATDAGDVPEDKETKAPDDREKALNALRNGGMTAKGRLKKKQPEMQKPGSLDLIKARGEPTSTEKFSKLAGGALTGAGLLASLIGNTGAINVDTSKSAGTQVARLLHAGGSAVRGKEIDDRYARELKAKTDYLASLPPEMRVVAGQVINRGEVARRQEKSAIDKWLDSLTESSDARLKVNLLRTDMELSDEEWKNIIDTDPHTMSRAILDEGPPFHPQEIAHLQKHLGDKYKYDDSHAHLWDDKVLHDYMSHVYNYYYKYKPEAVEHDPTIDPNEQHIGPMAQDLEKVNPAVVKEDDMGAKKVDTNRLALMNAGAIASLARQVEELKNAQ
jgi:hypothetical protein